MLAVADWSIRNQRVYLLLFHVEEYMGLENANKVFGAIRVVSKMKARKLGKTFHVGGRSAQLNC
jgi:hypothetical protein